MPRVGQLPRERLDDLWGRLGAGFGEERAVLDAIRAGGEGLLDR